MSTILHLVTIFTTLFALMVLFPAMAFMTPDFGFTTITNTIIIYCGNSVFIAIANFYQMYWFSLRKLKIEKIYMKSAWEFYGTSQLASLPFRMDRLIKDEIKKGSYCESVRKKADKLIKINGFLKINLMVASIIVAIIVLFK